MSDMIFVVDVAKCTACQKCEIACAAYNVKEMNAARARIAIFPRPSQKAGEAAGTPVTCLQCDDAGCVRSCQVGALTRSPVTGAIEVDHARCVRCKMCVAGCPFGNMAWDEPLHQVAKCDLCRGMPQCALACPSGALKYRPAVELAMPVSVAARGGR
jgi:Fe-S-cluster-containing dehydrogenase component